MEGTVAEYDASALDSLLEQVYRKAGYDFREYKRGTLTRRLTRRLYVHGLGTYQEYMHFLDAFPEEYQRLAEEITIKASGFFRTQYLFGQVTNLVLPRILRFKEERGERALRFWSAGCARGEEPYSIAVTLSEFLGKQLEDFDITIYATDISQWALAEAQKGTYTGKELEMLPPDIFHDYFIHLGENHEVRADIKRMVSFSTLDLASNEQPLFTEVDCMFCCNVLIYLQRKLQEKVLYRLYHSLTTPGYLVLGEVETPTGNLRDKLECLDSKAKIYKRVT